MKLIIAALVSLLVGTNAFWIYQAVDSGISTSYRDQNIFELNETATQLALTLTDVGETMPRTEFINIASKHTKFEPFEKDGCIWVGWIGLKFNEEDKLIYVSPEAANQADGLCAPAP